jgi:hypothetical protein
MINPAIIEAVDKWLDLNVAPEYQRQPLAQHWARILKGKEEDGEAIAELILATGQNPRKPMNPEARFRLLMELADAALTRVYAIQHFTKDIALTHQVLEAAQHKHFQRTLSEDEPKIKL